MIKLMARLDVILMKSNVPAKLHKVEPIAAVNINAIVMLMGCLAIVMVSAVMFNFMMDDFNLLLMRCI